MNNFWILPSFQSCVISKFNWGHVWKRSCQWVTSQGAPVHFHLSFFAVKCSWNTPAFFAEKLHKAMDVRLYLNTCRFSSCVRVLAQLFVLSVAVSLTVLHTRTNGSTLVLHCVAFTIWHGNLTQQISSWLRKTNKKAKNFPSPTTLFRLSGPGLCFQC